MQERIAVLGQQTLTRIRSAWQVYVAGRMAPLALSAAVAYYAGAQVGFMLRFPESPLSIIWPPNTASRRVAERVHARMRLFVWEKTGTEVCLYETLRSDLTAANEPHHPG